MDNSLAKRFLNNGDVFLSDTVTYSDILGKTADNLSVIYRLGYNQYQAGQYYDAARSFYYLCFYDHTNPDYFFSFGACLQVLGLYEDAIDQYFQAAILDVKNPAYPQALSDCYRLVGDEETALELSKTAREIRYTYIPNGASYSEMFMDTIKSSGIQQYSEFFSRGGGIQDLLPKENNLQSVLMLAHGQYKSGCYQQAAESFYYLCFYNHHEPDYFLGFGNSLQMLEIYDQAIDQYFQAAKLDIKNPEPLVFIGDCYMAMELEELCAEVLEEAIKIAKKYKVSSKNITRALHALDLITANKEAK